jgi:hypothetical protein
MTADPDDDALSWGDERDPTYVESADPRRDEQRRAPRERSGLDTTGGAGTGRAGRVAAGTAAEVPASDDRAADTSAGSDADNDAAPSMSSPMLLAIGILAGVYLLYTVGWFTSAARTIAVPVGAFDVAMYQLREWLSIAAPALWFGATLLLTRTRKASTRLLWLILGAIVLLPIPFVLGE